MNYYKIKKNLKLYKIIMNQKWVIQQSTGEIFV